MKIFTRVLKNIGIILAVFLCVFLIAFAYMFFAQRPFFGYRVRVYSSTGILTGADKERINLQTGYNEKSKTTKANLINGFIEEKADVNDYSLLINKVVVETASIPVSIIAVMPTIGGLEQSYITFTDRLLSFVKESDLESKDNPYKIFASKNGQELRITLNECPGLAVIGGSLLEIGIDYRFFKEAGTAIEIITDNSNVTVSKGLNGNGTNSYMASDAELAELKVSEFRMRAKNTELLFGGRGTFTGNINIEKLNIENIDGVINLKNADILGTADITTKKGSIIFGKVSSDSSKAIKIRSENSQVTFDEIKGGFSYTGYDTAALKEDRILESKGGKITGNNILGGLFIKTKDASFSAAVVKGQITTEISGKGGVNIKVYDQGNNSAESTIYGSKGKIAISSIINIGALSIKTTSGEISVSAGSTGEFVSEPGLYLETEKGKINYNGQNNAAVSYDLGGYVNQVTTGATNAYSGELTIKIKDSKNIKLENITGGCLFNITASKKMEGSIKLGRFASGSGIYLEDGKLDVTFNQAEKAYLVFNGEKAPKVSIRNVNSLLPGGAPTHICGATPIAENSIGNEEGQAPLITITNLRGSSNLHA